MVGVILVRLLPKTECLIREIFYTPKEAQVLIEQWRRFDNQARPHSSLRYRPPAPQTVLPRHDPPAYATLQPSYHGGSQSQILT